MVFGIGEGKIEIITDKERYVEGETINGKVALELKSPKKARELRIQFYGVIYEGGWWRSRRERRVFVQTHILDAKREYPVGYKVYDFQIKIPIIPKQKVAGEGLINNMLTLVANLCDPFRDITWYLDASLNMPGLDINKKKQINVSIS